MLPVVVLFLHVVIYACFKSRLILIKVHVGEILYMIRTKLCEELLGGMKRMNGGELGAKGTPEVWDSHVSISFLSHHFHNPRSSGHEYKSCVHPLETCLILDIALGSF